MTMNSSRRGAVYLKSKQAERVGGDKWDNIVGTERRGTHRSMIFIFLRRRFGVGRVPYTVHYCVCFATLRCYFYSGQLSGVFILTKRETHYRSARKVHGYGFFITDTNDRCRRHLTLNLAGCIRPARFDLNN